MREDKYVAGFAFSETLEYVVMIRKYKPQWQRGLLNAVGGKIEKDESALQAMVREFGEECNLKINPNWKQFVMLSGINPKSGPWSVTFFHTFILHDRDRNLDIRINYGNEEEPVEIFRRDYLMMNSYQKCIANIPMLLEAAVCSITFPKFVHLYIQEQAI